RAARLTERERRLRIDIDEHLFQRDLLGAVALDHFAQAREDRLQPLGQAVGRSGADAAARDVRERASGYLDDAEAGDPETRVDAKDPDGAGHLTGIIDAAGRRSGRASYCSSTAVV